MARVLRYPHKGPDRAKNDYLNTATGKRNIHESEKPDRYFRFLSQYQLRSMIERDRLMFAFRPQSIKQSGRRANEWHPTIWSLSSVYGTC